MSRPARVVAGGLAIVIVAGLLALVVGPARGARRDIATQKKLIAAQLATVRQQLALQRRQLEVAQQQRAISEQTRNLAAQTLTVARATKADADAQLDISRAFLVLMRQLETIAVQTLRHAADLDRKVP